MSGMVPTTTWRCKDHMEIVAIPRGVGVAERYVIIEGKGGDVEYVGTFWRSLRNASSWGEGWADVGVDTDFDLSVMEETGKDFDEDRREFRIKFGEKFNEFIVPDPVKSPTDISRYH